LVCVGKHESGETVLTTGVVALEAAQAAVVVYKDMMQEHEALQAACEGVKVSSPLLKLPLFYRGVKGS
jgi:hypothetical protein